MATPTTPEARTAAWFHLKQFLREQEDEHRRLLSMWVSELEPEFVYSRYGICLMGITVKGWRELVFYAKGWTRSTQVTHDHWTELMFSRPMPRLYSVPPDFHWNTGIDMAADDGDRSVRTVQSTDLRISFSVETIDPTLLKKVLQAAMPKVKK